MPIAQDSAFLWDLFLTFFSGAIGGGVAVVTGLLASRTDRRRRLQELYPEFVAAAENVYRRFPDFVGAYRQKTPEPEESGLDWLSVAHLKVLIAETDGNRLGLIDGIRGDAESMHGIAFQVDGPAPDRNEELDRKIGLWTAMDEKLRLLKDTLRGSLA